MTATNRPTTNSPDDSIEIPACPICGAAGRLAHRNVRDWVVGHEGTWTVRACNDAGCDALWLDPRPTPDALPHFYRNYYTHDRARDRRAGFVKRHLWPNPYSARERAVRDRIVPAGIPVGRLLEIGCGNGRNLAVLQHAGWDVEGQDFDPAAADLAAQLIGKPVQTNAIGSLTFAPASFDVVLTSHLLEHTDDPTRTLSLVHALLKPGGVSINYTPNAASFSHRVFGRHWRGIEAPRHLALLGPKSAKRALTESGFTHLEIATCGVGGGLVASSSIVKGPEITDRKRAAYLLFSFVWQLVDDVVGAVRPLTRWELRAIGTKKP